MKNDTTVARTTLQRVDNIEAKVDQLSLAIRSNSPLKDEMDDIQRSTASKSPCFDISEMVLKKESRIDSVTTQKCSCKSWYTSAASWNLGFIRGTFKERSRHYPTCPMFEVTQRTQRRAVRICLPFLRPATAYYVSFDVLVGAGGTRLQHRMVCRRVIPRDSPSFQLLRSEGLRPTADHINSIRTSLAAMFANGELFANDVDENGETLLHVSFICDKFVVRSCHTYLQTKHEL
jgi:hypothetical protein